MQGTVVAKRSQGNLLLGLGSAIQKVTRPSQAKNAVIGGYKLGWVAGNSVPKPQADRIVQPGVRLWGNHTRFDYAIRRETWQYKTLDLTGKPRS